MMQPAGSTDSNDDIGEVNVSDCKKEVTGLFSLVIVAGASVQK